MTKNQPGSHSCHIDPGPEHKKSPISHPLCTDLLPHLNNAPKLSIKNQKHNSFNYMTNKIGYQSFLCSGRIQTKEIELHYLDDTTSIWMSRKRGNLTSKSRNNKANFLCRNRFYALLYHMISILITDTSHNMTIKLKDQLCFLIKLNHFKGLEQGSRVKIKSHNI